MSVLEFQTSPLLLESEPPPNFRSSLAQHLRNDSSFSSATFVTQASDPLLPPPADSLEYHDMPSRGFPRVGGSSIGWGEGDPVMPHQKGFWETVTHKRLRRLKAVKAWTLLVIVAWAIYTAVRYFVAFVIYTNTTRRTVNLALGVSTLVALALVVALSSRRLLVEPLLHDRPDHLRVRRVAPHVFRYLISFFLFCPAAINFALVFIWRNATDAQLSLVGRCHWDLDVGWIGVGDSCSGGPSFGAWLAAAISRFVITLAVLSVYHIASHLYDAVRRPVQHSITEIKPSVEASALPDQPNPVASHPPPRYSRHSGHLASSPPAPTSPRSIWERRVTPPHTGSSGTSVARTSLESESDEDPGVVNQSSRHHQAASNTISAGLDTSDLQTFADRFRSLVGQVSQEIQSGLHLSPPDSPVTPPLHRVLDTHQPYMSLDEFGRPVVMEENIAVFGRTVRRMPTIESVGSREQASSIGHSLPLHSPGGASLMTGSSSRPPTRMTTYSSRASPTTSQPPSRSGSVHSPPSRSNSTHMPASPRMASELGEYVLTASRRAAGSISNGSFHTAVTSNTTPNGTHSTSGTGTTSRSESGVSKSDSVNGVLTPVNEHDNPQQQQHPTGSAHDGPAPSRIRGGIVLEGESRTESPAPVSEFGEGSSGNGGTGDSSQASTVYHSISSADNAP